MVTAHTGGWETVGSLVAKAEGLRMMFVMRPEASRGARALQDDVRKRAGVTVLHVGDDPLACLPLLTHLRGGGVVALQLDRVAPGMRTLDVVRFGRKATIPEGPVRLAQLSGAPILPVFCAREGHRRYLVEFCASRLVARRSTDSDVAEVAQHLADSLGAFLCAHPTQWFHFEH